jgi:hypothetical protein
VAVMVNGRKAMCMACPSEKGRAWTRDGEGRGVRPASAMWGSRSDGGGPGEWHAARSVTSGGPECHMGHDGRCFGPAQNE